MKNGERLSGRPSCEKHRCAGDECWSPKIAQSDFCRGHTCSVPNCLFFVPRRRGRCGEHGRCEVDYCKEIRYCSEGRFEMPYCWGHICQFDDSCGFRRMTMKGRYCAKHTCVRKGCRRRVKPGREYCTKHGNVEAKAAECRRAMRVDDRGEGRSDHSYSDSSDDSDISMDHAALETGPCQHAHRCPDQGKQVSWDGEILCKKRESLFHRCSSFTKKKQQIPS